MSKKQLNIALDVDGVLANFYLAMCRRYNKPYKVIDRWEEPWLADKVKETFDDHEFWENLPVLNPPESIHFDISCYMTSIPPSLIEPRKNWLLKNGFPDKPIVACYDKHAMCPSLKIDVLVDDRPKTVREVIGIGVKCVQFIPHYLNVEEESLFVAKDMLEVNEIIRKFAH